MMIHLEICKLRYFEHTYQCNVEAGSEWQINSHQPQRTYDTDRHSELDLTPKRRDDMKTDAKI